MVFVLSALINMRHLLAATLKMSNIGLALILATLIGGVMPVAAQFAQSSLTRPEIRSEMFGQMFTGEYSNGGRWA